MNPPLFAQVVFNLPLAGPFDYSIPAEMQAFVSVGQRVSAPLGRRSGVGIIVSLNAVSFVPSSKLKSLLQLLDEGPLFTADMLQLAKEVSMYYGCSWGEALNIGLPRLLRGFRKTTQPLPKEAGSRSTLAQPNVSWLPTRKRSAVWPILLGKIQETLAQKKSVLYLVPELSGLKGVLETLKEKREDLVVMDRQVTPTQELKRWERIRTGGALWVLGTRASVFAPIQNLGLVILEDEDCPSYKEEQKPFYHARDIALWRARLTSSPMIFVSAAPSLEMWSAFLKDAAVPIPAPSSFPLAGIQPVDMTQYPPRPGQFLSIVLREAMDKTLKNKGRILLFLNRRGFSTFTQCPHCGYALACQHCSSHLVYHLERKDMFCRHCAFAMPAPSLCPSCHQAYLKYLGVGIEKLESEMLKNFSGYQVAHFDKDVAQLPRDADILIATQAILQLEAEPVFSLVGVLQIDSQLNRIDYRSGCQTFVLLDQLKNLAQEKMIIQTRLADHPAIRAVVTGRAEPFYEEELNARRDLNLPPFAHLVTVMARAEKEAGALAYLQQLYQGLLQKKLVGIEVFEPRPDALARLRDKYRFVLLLKGVSASEMVSLIQSVILQTPRRGRMVLTIQVD